MASNGIMFISNFIKTDILSFKMKQTDGKRGRWRDMISLKLINLHVMRRSHTKGMLENEQCATSYG
jgi:hypothetical protein